MECYPETKPGNPKGTKMTVAKTRRDRPEAINPTCNMIKTLCAVAFSQSKFSLNKTHLFLLELVKLLMEGSASSYNPTLALFVN